MWFGARRTVDKVTDTGLGGVVSYNVFDIVCSVSWKYASAHRQNEKWLNSRHRLCLGEPCGMIPIRF